MSKFHIVTAVVIFLSGCASSQYAIQFDSTPEGATLVCGGKNWGYTPETLYIPKSSIKGQTELNLSGCTATWVSGAQHRYGTVSLTQYPDGVRITAPRPNVEGYSQDAEFALRVREMRATERAANAVQQNSNNSAYQNTNTVNCKKMGEFLNVEIKTFSGAICPLGWIQAY